MKYINIRYSNEKKHEIHLSLMLHFRARNKQIPMSAMKQIYMGYWMYRPINMEAMDLFSLQRIGRMSSFLTLDVYIRI